MQPLGEFLDVALAVIWRASWQAAVLAAVVLVLQWVLGGRLAAKWRFALWSVVLLRLLVPVVPESRWSVFNLSTPSHTVAAPGSVPREKQLGPPGANGAELPQRGSSAVLLRPTAHVTAGAARRGQARPRVADRD